MSDQVQTGTICRLETHVMSVSCPLDGFRGSPLQPMKLKSKSDI